MLFLLAKRPCVLYSKGKRKSEATVLNQTVTPAPGPSGKQILKRIGETISDGLFTLVKWNVLFLFTCVPIITIGPALTALLFCTNALVKDDLPQERASALYLNTFRACFLRALPSGLLTLAVCLVFGTGFFLYSRMISAQPFYIPFASLSLIVLFFFWGVMIHLFPRFVKETDWEKKTVTATDESMRTLFSQATSDALLRIRKTIPALLLAAFFLLGQLLLFPVTVPLTVTIGFSMPALAVAFAHTDPEL